VATPSPRNRQSGVVQRGEQASVWKLLDENFCRLRRPHWWSVQRLARGSFVRWQRRRRGPWTFASRRVKARPADAHFRSFEDQVLPVLLKARIGVLAMKTFGDHFILQSKTVTPLEALHYSMTLPTSVVITGIDSLQVLDQAIEAARTFKPMTKEAVAALLSRTKPAALNGRFELYKTSQHFDGTAKNPQWLG
jgi:hypothetical protein